MQLETDSKDNRFVNAENVRITIVNASDRDPATDWAGTDVIRIQAY